MAILGDYINGNHRTILYIMSITYLHLYRLLNISILVVKCQEKYYISYKESAIPLTH